MQTSALPERLLAQLVRRRQAQRLTGRSELAEGGRDASLSGNVLDRLKRSVMPAPDSQSAGEFVEEIGRLQQSVEDAHDAFLIDPGMGPMAYVTSDGRVLLDGRAWDGTDVREATDQEAFAALVVGATKTGITELLDLIPSCPLHGTRCPACTGTRWTEPSRGFPHKIVCFLCGGRGWVVEEMLVDASARGIWPRGT